MSRLAIVGAGGHGKVVAEAAELSGWTEIEFFDDAWPEKNFSGAWHIVGDMAALIEKLDEYEGCIVAIGNNLLRLNKTEELLHHHANIVTVTHPTAIISKYATVSPGCAVLAGSTINPFTKIGLGCIINTNASVDHDCEISDGVHICPNSVLAGGVRVGRLSWLGIGSTILQQIEIGDGCFIGASSLVTKDLPKNQKVKGIPARSF